MNRLARARKAVEVHIYSKIHSLFNKGQPKFLKEFDAIFEKAENMPVKYDVHGWIVVTDNAYYDATGAVLIIAPASRRGTTSRGLA